MRKLILQHQLEQYRETVTGSLSEAARAQARTLVQQGDGLTALLGGLGSIDQNLWNIGADLARLVATTDTALPLIVEHLAGSAQTLSDISRMIASPRETEAAELYRTGTYALSRGLIDDAVIDLRQATTIHRYHPRSWYHLGVALLRQGSIPEAADAFGRCAQYGIAANSPHIAATAVLLSAAAHRQAGNADQSEEILRRHLGQLSRCAEIHFALALHHRAPGELRRAFDLWPFLVADARAAGHPDAEKIATHVNRGPDSAYTNLRRLWQALEELDETVRSSELQGVSPAPPRIKLPANGVEALLLAVSTLPVTTAQAAQIATEVRAAVIQLEEATQDTRAHAVRIQGAETAKLHQAQAAINSRLREADDEVSRATKMIEALSTALRNCFTYFTYTHDVQLSLESIKGDPAGIQAQLDKYMGLLPTDRPWIYTAANDIKLKYRIELMTTKAGHLRRERDSYRARANQYKARLESVHHYSDGNTRSAINANLNAASQRQVKLDAIQDEIEEAKRQLSQNDQDHAVHQKQQRARRAAEEQAAKDALQAVEAQVAHANQQAQAAAEAAASQAEQAAQAVTGPLQALEAILASIPPPAERLIPFDPQNF